MNAVDSVRATLAACRSIAAVAQCLTDPLQTHSSPTAGGVPPAGRLHGQRDQGCQGLPGAAQAGAATAERAAGTGGLAGGAGVGFGRGSRGSCRARSQRPPPRPHFPGAASAPLSLARSLRRPRRRWRSGCRSTWSRRFGLRDACSSSTRSTRSRRESGGVL